MKPWKDMTPEEKEMYRKRVEAELVRWKCMICGQMKVSLSHQVRCRPCLSKMGLAAPNYAPPAWRRLDGILD